MPTDPWVYTANPSKNKAFGIWEHKGQHSMPSLTPLHETYCRWDRTPPSQADILEGLAQLVSTRLNAVMSEVIQTIQREVLLSVFGMSEQRSQKFQKTATFQKLYKFAFHSLQQYGYHFVAPGLRQIIA